MPSIAPTTTAEAVSSLKPRAFTLELTKGCNLRCGYCYYAQRESAYNPSDRMSREVAEKSVEMLVRDGPSDEPLHLHFFGGEPLLNFPLLQSTVLYAERRAGEAGKSFTFEVTTNGTLFTDDVIEFLNEHRIHVGVSFDGPPHVQDVARPSLGGGSYALADPKIRQLLASRIGTDLEPKSHCSVVVTRRELDLLKIVRHLEGMGFQKIILTPATDLTGETHGVRQEDLPVLLGHYSALAREYEQSLLEGRSFSVNLFPSLMNRLVSGQKKFKYCDGGREYLGVAADGNVHLCYRFYQNDDFGMGSVQEGLDRGVTERLYALPVEKKTDCSVCWARYYCGGGCHHDNLISGGGLGKPNPITCDILRHNMSLALEVWGRLAKSGKVPEIAPTLEQPMSGNENEVAFADTDRPILAPGCHQRDLGGEKVIYNPESHQVVILNQTALFILDRCDGSHSIHDVLEAMKGRYAASADVLRNDLLETLGRLRSKKILLEG